MFHTDCPYALFGATTILQVCQFPVMWCSHWPRPADRFLPLSTSHLKEQQRKYTPRMLMKILYYTGLILGLHPANERRCYKLIPSLIGWAQIWNQLCNIYSGFNGLGKDNEMGLGAPYIRGLTVGQYCGCWLPGSLLSRLIRSHGIDNAWCDMQEIFFQDEIFQLTSYYWEMIENANIWNANIFFYVS